MTPGRISKRVLVDRIEWIEKIARLEGARPR